MVLLIVAELVYFKIADDTPLAHWVYLIVVGLLLVGAYVLFMKKYYHLHEEYLEQLKVKNEKL